MRQPASFSIDVTTCAGDEGGAFYAIFFCVILVLLCCWGGAAFFSHKEQARNGFKAGLFVFVITFGVWCGLFFGYNYSEIKRSLDYYPAALDGTCLVTKQGLSPRVCCETSNDECTYDENGVDGPTYCHNSGFQDCSTMQTSYESDGGQLCLPQLNSTLVVPSKCCVYYNGAPPQMITRDAVKTIMPK